MNKDAIIELENYIFEHKAKPSVAASMVAGIIGVIIGVKPAAIYDFDADEYADLDFGDCIEVFNHVDLKILFFRHEYVERGKIAWIEDVCIAQDVETANRLHQAFEKLRDTMDDVGQICDQERWEETSREIGHLLGYPETAVEYFVTEQDIDNEERKRLMERYRFYVHSPKHHEEEYQAYDRNIFQALQEYAPKSAKILTDKNSH